MKKINRRSFLKVSGVYTAVLGMAACGTSSSVESSSSDVASTDGEVAASDGIELEFFWWGSQNRNEKTIAACDLYTEQNPTVTFEPILGDWSTYWQKLSTDAAGKNMADIIQQDPVYITQYIENGLLVPLDDYVASGVLDISKIDPNLLVGTTNNGKLYGISSGQNTFAVAYNKTFLDENGFTVDSVMDLDTFCELGKEIYEKTGMKTEFPYISDAKYLDYFVRGEGYLMYSDAGDALGFDDPTVLIPVFETVQKGVTEGWMLGPEAYAEVDVTSLEQKAIVAGTNEMNTAWCTFIMANQVATVAIQAREKGFELGMTMWPSRDTAKSAFIITGMPLCVTTDSENPEEAAKFINYWVNSIECNEILAAERGIPLNSEVATALIPSLEPDQQMFATFITETVANNSSAPNKPAPPKAGEAEDIMMTILEQVYYKQITPEEAAKTLIEQANAVLGS